MTKKKPFLNFIKKTINAISDELKILFKDVTELILFDQRVETEYGIECVTEKGITVKSRAEKAIADELTYLGYDYEYEPKLYYNRTQYILPDFYIKKHDFYIEYWGLVDVDDNKLKKKYRASKKWKIGIYRKLGKSFVSLYPSQVQSLDFTDILKDKIEEYGK